jgi:hypothetical protein
MGKYVIDDFKKTGTGIIAKLPNMKYFPGHNAFYIKYISGSGAHDKINMGYGNGYLKGFKAAKSQTPNLPSPPFPFLWSPRPGSSYSLTPLKAQKTTWTQRHTTLNTSVTSIVSLCPGGALYIN